MLIVENWQGMLDSQDFIKHVGDERSGQYSGTLESQGFILSSFLDANINSSNYSS